MRLRFPDLLRPRLSIVVHLQNLAKIAPRRSCCVRSPRRALRDLVPVGAPNCLCKIVIFLHPSFYRAMSFAEASSPISLFILVTGQSVNIRPQRVELDGSRELTRAVRPHVRSDSCHDDAINPTRAYIPEQIVPRSLPGKGLEQVSEHWRQARYVSRHAFLRCRYPQETPSCHLGHLLSR